MWRWRMPTKRGTPLRVQGCVRAAGLGFLSVPDGAERSCWHSWGLAWVAWVLAGPLAVQAVGAEWTRFRGPNGSGAAQAENLPVRWTEKDYNWRVTLPGVGHSSPVLWGDRIFLTSGDRKSAKRSVLCLKASDGSTLWQRDFESKRHPINEANSFASSTPAVDAERVYLYWTTPDEITLLALTHDGKDVWRRDLGRYECEHGGGTSPIVFEELVVLNNGQTGKCSLLAVDRKTGKTAWDVERHGSDIDERAAYSVPMVYQPDVGPPQILFSDNWSRGITSVDPQSGKVLWQARGVLSERCVGSPVVACGLVVAASGSDVPAQVTAVRPPAKGEEARVAWTYAKSPPYVPTPVAKDDLLFLWNDSGTVTCLRAATGEKAWRERIGSDFLGSPVRVGDRLYCMSRQGDCFVVAAGEKFELLGRNPLGEGSHATPAVAGGVLYLRTFSHLISLGGKK
jgi:outer membrane protein assembly factor BamB